MIPLISTRNFSFIALGSVSRQPDLPATPNIWKGRADWYPNSFPKTSPDFVGDIGPSGRNTRVFGDTGTIPRSDSKRSRRSFQGDLSKASLDQTPR